MINNILLLKKVTILSFGLLATTPCFAGSAVTLLVDFMGMADKRLPFYEESSPTDFAVLDPQVDLAAFINQPKHNGLGLTMEASNLSGVTLDIARASSSWTTQRGNFSGDPQAYPNDRFAERPAIMGSYIYADSGLAANLVIHGLADIEPGEMMTLTLYGAGDTENDDTQFQVVYAGVTHDTLQTDYDAGTIKAASVQLKLRKVAGEDSIRINWGGVNGVAGFNGFSLTASAGAAVPEPTMLR